jgi:hypothetical protein
VGGSERETVACIVSESSWSMHGSDTAIIMHGEAAECRVGECRACMVLVYQKLSREAGASEGGGGDAALRGKVTIACVCVKWSEMRRGSRTGGPPHCRCHSTCLCTLLPPSLPHAMVLLQIYHARLLTVKLGASLR